MVHWIYKINSGVFKHSPGSTSWFSFENFSRHILQEYPSVTAIYIVLLVFFHFPVLCFAFITLTTPFLAIIWTHHRGQWSWFLPTLPSRKGRFSRRTLKIWKLLLKYQPNNWNLARPYHLSLPKDWLELGSFNAYQYRKFFFRDFDDFPEMWDHIKLRLNNLRLTLICFRLLMRVFFLSCPSINGKITIAFRKYRSLYSAHMFFHLAVWSTPHQQALPVIHRYPR